MTTKHQALSLANKINLIPLLYLHKMMLNCLWQTFLSTPPLFPKTKGCHQPLSEASKYLAYPLSPPLLKAASISTATASTMAQGIRLNRTSLLHYFLHFLNQGSIVLLGEYLLKTPRRTAAGYTTCMKLPCTFLV